MGEISRRLLLCGPLVATARGALADDAPNPAKVMPPQPNDFLVLAGGDNETVPLRPADLKTGDDPAMAWALDPGTKLPRDGTRLNQVLLMRFDPASFGEHEKPWAADGVVAFSAICTHQQCTVAYWLTAQQVLQCPCHQSEYDPRHGARVVAGPAPRPLPALPLKVADGVLVVAGAFTDRVGGEQQRG
jgi:rieske iron-sulfur protein